MNKHNIITLAPGETLHVRGATSEYGDTALFYIWFDIEEGFCTATVRELYEDSALSLTNTWELPPETPYAPV